MHAATLLPPRPTRTAPPLALDGDAPKQSTQIVEWTVACVTAGLVRPASTSSAGVGVRVGVRVGVGLGVGLGEWLAGVGVALTVTLGATVALAVGVAGAEG
jgi:hypothetical protein